MDNNLTYLYRWHLLNSGTDFLDFPSKCMLLTLYFAYILGVLFFKCLVFNLAFKKGILSREPINVLILVDELEKLIGFIYSSFTFTLKLLGVFGVYVEIFGWQPCKAKVFGLFQLSCFYYGGFAISVMRLVYIRGTTLIQRWGETKIVVAILIISQCAILGTVYLLQQNTHPDLPLACPSDSLFTFQMPPFFLFGSICGSLIIAELLIYLNIFYFIYRANSNIGPFIPVKSFKRRQKQNAYDFAGHCLHFFMELGILVLTSQFKAFGVLPGTVVLFSNGFLSAGLIIFSRPLQTELSLTLVWIEELFHEARTLNMTSLDPPAIVIQEASSVLSVGGKSTSSHISIQTTMLEMPVRTGQEKENQIYLLAPSALRRPKIPEITDCDSVNQDKQRAALPNVVL